MNAQPNAGSNHREHYPAEVRKLFRVGTHASFRQGFRSLPASGFRTKRFTFPLTGGVPVRLSKTRPDVRSPRYDLTIAIVPASTSTSRWPALVFEVISS